MSQQEARVSAVLKGSLAERMGIKAGHVLLAVNDQPVTDILDFRLASSSEQVRVAWRDDQGQEHTATVEKQFGQDLGIVFSSPTIDRLKFCQNNCQFCFVDQQPRNMRRTLSLKDDDYRLSALQGSFVTLTNLNQSDWQRILDLRPSPLYISVHTTNGELRTELLRNPRAGKIMQQLQQLASRRIEMHCQVVLVPGINDGSELEKTVADLSSLWPAVQSIAVVPVGLTKHRQHLAPLCSPTPADARALIDHLLPKSMQFRRKLGVSFVYLADEWFVLAGSLPPGRRYYDDFPQIENGVGLLRQLLDQFASAWRRSSRRVKSPRHVIWVTGTSAASSLRALASRLNRIAGLWVDVLPVTNQVFGPSVTVAGLVCGRDIIAALRRLRVSDVTVLIPDVMLRPEEGDFLDDITWEELVSEFTDANLQCIPTDGHALVKYTLGEEGD
ncbi:MAG: DUF512 domain-containing protein [Bacillota bacterium]|jgi:putative radical SAM enzyme (TIGR03279 family)